MAPYVTAVQYKEPTKTPAAKNGDPRRTNVSIPSRTLAKTPIVGRTIIYSV